MNNPLQAAAPEIGRWHHTLVAENGVRASPRPLSVGFYSEEVNRTFFVWSGHSEQHGGSQPFISYYDHGSASLGPHIDVAGINDLDIPNNHHHYPHLARDKEGYLHIFVSRIGSFHFRSKQPFDIESGWEAQSSADPKESGFSYLGSYPMPTVTDDGDIIVFFRDENHPKGAQGTAAYIRSTDGGRHWSPKATLVSFRDDGSRLNTIYPAGLTHISGGSQRSEEILFTWVNAGAGPDEKDSSYYDTYHQSVFLIRFDPKTGTSIAPDGHPFGAIVNKQEAWQHALVFDGSPLRTSGDLGERDSAKKAVGYFAVPALTSDGTLVVAFEYWKDRGLPDKLFVSRRPPEAKDWMTTNVGDYANPDLHLDEAGTLRLFAYDYDDSLRGKIALKGGTVTIFQSQDGGARWTKEAEVPEDIRITRAYAIEHGRPDASLLLMEYNDGNWPRDHPSAYQGIFKVWLAGSKPLAAP